MKTKRFEVREGIEELYDMGWTSSRVLEIPRRWRCAAHLVRGGLELLPAGPEFLQFPELVPVSRCGLSL